MSAALQLELCEAPPRVLTLAERFEAFDAANPHVWRAFERFAFEAVRAGRTRIGAKAIWERMRWWSTFETSDPEFKINNSYTAHYARKWIRLHPEHAGLFELRGA